NRAAAAPGVGEGDPARLLQGEAVRMRATRHSRPVDMLAVGRAPLPGEDPVSIRLQRLHASPLAADLALDDDLMLAPVGRAAPDLHVPVPGVCDERETEREDGACLGAVVDV